METLCDVQLFEKKSESEAYVKLILRKMTYNVFPLSRYWQLILSNKHRSLLTHFVVSIHDSLTTYVYNVYKIPW